MVDGYAAGATAGDMSVGENYYHAALLDFDLKPKPAYNVIKNLIKNEWVTECEATSNECGIAEFKGFFGKYDVEITLGEKILKKEINLSKSGYAKNMSKDFEIII